MTGAVTDALQTLERTHNKRLPFFAEVEEFQKQHWPQQSLSDIEGTLLEGSAAGMNRVFLLTNKVIGEKVVLRTLDSMKERKSKLWETAVTRCMGEQPFAPKLLYSSESANVMFLEYVEGGTFRQHLFPVNWYHLGRALRELHDLSWKKELEKTPEFQELQQTEQVPNLNKSMIIDRFHWMIQALEKGLGSFLDSHAPFLRKIQQYVESLDATGPFSFCHLDLNDGNILNPAQPRMIDWTLGGPDHPEREIATLMMSRSTVTFDEFYEGYCRKNPTEIPAIKKKVNAAMAMALIGRGTWGVWDFVGGFKCAENTQEDQEVKAKALAEQWAKLEEESSEEWDAGTFFKRIAEGFKLSTHENRRNFGLALLKEALSLI